MLLAFLEVFGSHVLTLESQAPGVGFLFFRGRDRGVWSRSGHGGMRHRRFAEVNVSAGGFSLLLAKRGGGIDLRGNRWRGGFVLGGARAAVVGSRGNQAFDGDDHGE